MADLDDVIVLHDFEREEDGRVLREGAEGTIMSVHKGGEAYTVEFCDGSLWVLPGELLRRSS